MWMMIKMKLLRKIAHYDLIALPVIDHQGTLLGIVTYDDAMDVASEEANEDFLKVGGVEASAPSLNIKEASLFLLYRKRVFWLVILVFGSLLSGLGISHFESVIQSNIVLVFSCHYWLEVEEMQARNRPL
jgi:magnesium transporter